MNAHNGLRKPNLKRKKEELSELEDLLAVVGLEVTTEGMRSGTGKERWRERVPDFKACNAETPSAGGACDR